MGLAAPKTLRHHISPGHQGFYTGPGERCKGHERHTFNDNRVYHGPPGSFHICGYFINPSTGITVMASGTVCAAVVAGANGDAGGSQDAPRTVPPQPASSMAEGQARYVRASGVDPGSARRAMRSNGRDLSVARAPGTACVVDTAGAALCADDADIAAGRALSFVACGPGMRAGTLRVTGLVPREVRTAITVGRRVEAEVRDGALALEVEAPRGGGEVRMLLEGGARPIEATLRVPADLDDRPCGASEE